MNVQFRRVPVHFTVEGNGPAVLLLHGFLEDISIYDGMTEALSRTHRVVRIDLPGHGLSGVVGYRHAMEDVATAVRQVLDTIGIDSCTLVGHSMGGYVALAFAELFLMKTDGLVLFHSSALADSEAKLKDRERAITLVRKNAEAFVRNSVPMLFADAARERLGAEISALTDRAAKFPARGIVANIRGMMARPDRTHVLRDSAFPVLIIHGALDPVIPTEAILAQAALSLRIRLEVLEGIGHMGHLEAADECLRLIVSFLGEKKA